MPRHPPCALNNLTTQTQHKTKNQSDVKNTKKNQMLASTIQFSNTNPNHPPTSTHQPRPKPRQYRSQRIPDQKHHPAGVASGPNSMPTHHQLEDPPPRFPHPPRGSTH